MQNMPYNIISPKAFKIPVKIARKLITKYTRQDRAIYDGYANYANEQANELVKNELLKDKPFMICKFGTTEFGTILNYLSIQEPKRIKDLLDYIKRKKIFLWWWDNGYEMAKQSGFFPTTDRMLERFCELMFDDIKEIDILCSYMEAEKVIKKELAHTKKINHLGLFAPFQYKNPWTESLAGKKVLVVHPFEESIRSQYKKRKLLFENDKVLPEFELTTIKAVQTIANNPSKEFKDWFEALNSMKDKISNTNFDIALIGCGAYGLPLAAHVKRLGKKGIHLASYTQILFGIYGKRWESTNEFSKIINEHWVRPLPSEVPPNFKKVEGGAYW
jgi:hypothetical protein